MLFFLIGGLVVLVVVAVLLRPFWSVAASDDARDREITIYTDQLAEVDRDLDRGVINEAEAQSARTEIERRLLSAARRADDVSAKPSRPLRAGLAVAVAVLPLLAVIVYGQIGAPGQKAEPFASRTTPAQIPGLRAGLSDAEQIAALSEHLATVPDDVEALRMLARAHVRMGNYQPALDALRTANRVVDGQDISLSGEYAEIMVIANDGTVTAPARQIFTAIQEAAPDNPQAAFYLALALAQDGQTEDALTRLRELRDRSDSDAPWMSAVAGLINALEAPVAPALDPDTADAVIRDMSPAEQQAFIEQMVGRLEDRLEEQPGNLEGWRRLAQAYEVLGRAEDAQRAYAQILKIAPDDEEASARLNTAAD
ncbi:c-type cytochrome biogenesis protein CcmI [Parvularcula sp. LCG005]|uniref:c-type cytochrome biogenesis protein CcmI n=1 Tax=Parvularcula sp. LCG005 TaxID=3078805 RepID=UPI0029431DAF|nr:c-type cytochrome biogenesis protein CcmI [Parvularcula sp. LCG005]WOI53073.1 c-type cytochrome biogenesis protein CcmI [Parvularcula sp. LCG005]